jgi:hypothetical protein
MEGKISTTIRQGEQAQGEVIVTQLYVPLFLVL